MKLSAQLYSVKEDCQKDFIGTLKAIKDMGYTGVEFAGYYDFEPAILKQELDAIGLEAVSAHVSLEALTHNLEQEIQTLKTLGAKYIVCPYSQIKTKEETVALATTLNEIGKVCQANGLTLMYHNHAHEFEVDQDQYLLDIFYDTVDAEIVKQEVDVFWVAYAGIDVYEYLRQHGKRNCLVHLKQLENMDTKANVEAGRGNIDFKKIMEIVPDAQFIYEQESFEGSRLEEMARSYTYISTL